MALRAARAVLAIGFGLLFGMSASVNAETLKIGVIGAMTGGAAEYGLAAREATRILADETNAKGGVDIGGKKYKLDVVAYDDQQKPADAVAAYNRLVNVDGVKYIFLQSSSSTLALKDNAERDKVVLLSAAFSDKIIDNDTKYTFRIYLNGANFVPSLITWMKGNLSDRSVVTLNPNDETGWGQTQVTAKYYKDNGFKLLSSELYERNQKDFAPVLTKLIALKPDLMDFGTSPPATTGLIVRQARELGYKGRFVQTGGPGWDAVVAAAGKPEAEGMITVLYADPKNQAYENLAQAYRRNVNQAPNEIIANFYDAGRVLLKAIQLAGDPNDTAKVAASMAKVLPMKSLQGDTLTAGHQQIMTVDYIGQIKDGAPTIVGKLK